MTGFPLISNGSYVKEGDIGVFFRASERHCLTATFNATETLFPILSEQNLKELKKVRALRQSLRNSYYHHRAYRARYDDDFIYKTNYQTRAADMYSQARKHVTFVENKLRNSPQKKPFTTIGLDKGELVVPLTLTQCFHLFGLAQKGRLIEFIFDAEGALSVQARKGAMPAPRKKPKLKF